MVDQALFSGEGFPPYVKAEVGEQALAYEALAEVMADIRTIEAQLVSPRAKTAVVRACLVGLRDLAGAQWQKRFSAILR